jgi:methylglyoxal synthase
VVRTEVVVMKDPKPRQTRTTGVSNSAEEPMPVIGPRAGVRRRIALVAHDHMKADLLEWARFNSDVLAQHDLFGTGTTGGMIARELELDVALFKSGPLGGDQQLGAKIAEGDLDLVLFFWDPLEPQPHDPDVRALLRIAVVWNIPIACNRATADYLISSPLLDSDYQPLKPDYDSPSAAGKDAGTG